MGWDTRGSDLGGRGEVTDDRIVTARPQRSVVKIARRLAAFWTVM